MATGQATSFLLNYSGESVKNEGTTRGRRSVKRPAQEIFQPYPSISQKNVAPMPARPTRSTSIIPEEITPTVMRGYEERVPTWSGSEMMSGAPSSYMLGYSGEAVGQKLMRKQPNKQHIIKQYAVKRPKIVQKTVQKTPKLLHTPKMLQKEKYKSNKNNSITTPKLNNIKSRKYINSNISKMYPTGKASKKIPKFKGF
jgi:hypothetical protein